MSLENSNLGANSNPSQNKVAVPFSRKVVRCDKHSVSYLESNGCSRCNDENRKGFVVTEFEGYTGRKIQSKIFNTFEEAEAFYNERKSLNRVAGIGGKYNHYWSYPQEVS